MSTLTAALLSIGLSGLGQLLLRRGAMEVAPIFDLTMTQAQTWVSLLLSGWFAAGLGAWWFDFETGFAPYHSPSWRQAEDVRVLLCSATALLGAARGVSRAVVLSTCARILA